ncbi:MAG: threonine ammonia-lyase, biosynthetic [Kiritimatiellae bacterium]|nr:threonine ammonia-lyase, biosynthetic [Kiritimatiellia bacterium]
MTDRQLKAHYLRKILNSRVYDVADETPLEVMSALSRRFGCTMMLKREDLQCVHSFKLRGAYNKMSQLSKAALERGVLAASAGNHAQGVALAASRLGCKATIVMPVTTPEIKTASVKALGASIVLSGDSYSDAAAEAHRLVKKHGYTFIPPYDDPDVIAGQGTVAMEILRQHSGPLDAIFVPVGGGGFAAGVAVYVKAVRPEVKVFGVEPTDSDCMYRSIRAGRRIEMSEVGLFADGVAVKRPGRITFDICRRFLDGIVRVSTSETCAAIKDIFEATRAVCEPAGALALAAAKQYARGRDPAGRTYACIVSGANMNFDRIRFVAEETEIGEKREAILECRIPEVRGAFKKFIRKIGKRSVTEFNYRYSDPGHAHVFVGLAVADREEARRLVEALKAANIDTIDLSDDALAKEHIRHMVGGHTQGIHDEVVYSFEFPERPGALMDFLEAMSNSWNITLFHYRNHGADHGKVLAGLQVPAKERKAFRAALAGLGYACREVTAEPAYRLFLGNRD